jgi:hypothetical protein
MSAPPEVAESRCMVQSAFPRRWGADDCVVISTGPFRYPLSLLFLSIIFLRDEDLYSSQKAHFLQIQFL